MTSRALALARAGAFCVVLSANVMYLLLHKELTGRWP